MWRQFPRVVFSLSLFLVLTYVCMMIMTLFGLTMRKQVCRTKTEDGKITSTAAKESVEKSDNISPTFQDVRSGPPEDSTERYRRCLNLTMFYFNAVAFFIGGLGIGLSLKRGEWTTFIVVPPVLFFLSVNIPAFKDFLLQAPKFYTLPFLVSESYFALVLFSVLSFIGGYIVNL